MSKIEGTIRLSDFEKGVVVGMRECGKSFHDIAEEVGYEESVIRQCWSQWNEEQKKPSKEKNSGKKQIK
ncbi:hypothetical protein X975_06659, partial [Stegodyphus mimosarum]